MTFGRPLRAKMERVTLFLAVGGTHLFLNANTVFPELKIATDTVSREMLKPNEACYQ